MTDSPHFKRIEMSYEGKVAALTLASDKVNALDREVLAEMATFVGSREQAPGIDDLAERLGFGADLLDAEEACLCGLAHQHLPRSEVRTSPISLAEEPALFDARADALAKASSRRTVLASSEDGRARLLDRQVGDHRQDDPTRASLERLLSK